MLRIPLVVGFALVAPLLPTYGTAQARTVAPGAVVRYELHDGSANALGRSAEPRRGELVRMSSDSLTVRGNAGRLATVELDRIRRLEVYAGRSHRSFWSGAGTGALIGGAVLGGIGLLAAVDEDDDFFGPAILVLVPTGTGLIAGGLIGGFAARITTIEVWEQVELTANLPAAASGVRIDVSLRH